MSGMFSTFIVGWIIIMVVLMAIGGFFMFRKFLKQLPKQDGKSELDWQNYYLHKTLHLWQDEHKALLNELTAPVPELFRPVAKEKIGGMIGKLAVEERAKTLTLDLIIRGYIMASPKRDHKFLRKKLHEMDIDLSPYEHLLQDNTKQAVSE
ncbi:DUF2621 family protein [Caryophanon tenue]|uniref:DUF2621 domain-containing protein n=1 Tax=Caryophanon tenue TaxID=33978 RepID=A0A1C0Y750_9BACL|nr:DUF2621 family protein [Caryophanon tenue]OCS82974.1 hypothetical protein A6M13_06120 [Caryophanon tenue]